jgi:hypothetical protein
MTLRFADGTERTIKFPVEEAPVVFFFPVFSPPALIEPGDYKGGVRIRGNAMVGYGNGYKTTLVKHGAISFGLSQTIVPVTFARMIAKIAYAMAYADGSLNRLETIFPIVSSILGKTDDVGKWVGSYNGLPEKQPGLLHHLAGREHRDRGLFVYEVQLFADSQAPLYSVILGKPKSAPGPQSGAV